jgi:hypothetical protein
MPHTSATCLYEHVDGVWGGYKPRPPPKGAPELLLEALELLSALLGACHIRARAPASMLYVHACVWVRGGENRMPELLSC